MVPLIALDLRPDRVIVVPLAGRRRVKQRFEGFVARDPSRCRPHRVKDCPYSHTSSCRLTRKCHALEGLSVKVDRDCSGSQISVQSRDAVSGKPTHTLAPPPPPLRLARYSSGLWVRDDVSWIGPSSRFDARQGWLTSSRKHRALVVSAFLTVHVASLRPSFLFRKDGNVILRRLGRFLKIRGDVCGGLCVPSGGFVNSRLLSQLLNEPSRQL